MFWPFNTKAKLKLVCFDIDNTLCDFSSAESFAEASLAELISKDIAALQKKNKKKGAIKNPCSAFTVLRTFNEIKKRHIYNDLLPEKYSRLLWFKETLERIDDESALGIDMNKMISSAKDYEAKYWSKLNFALKNYDSAISVLQSLKSQGLKIAAVTDSDGIPKMKQKRMKLLGLYGFFDYIITAEDAGQNKPAQENWTKLLDVSGLKGSECMMVGDHPAIDLASPKRLGFVTVWTKQHLNNDLHQKYIDYEIKDIKELPAIIQKYI